MFLIPCLLPLTLKYCIFFKKWKLYVHLNIKHKNNHFGFFLDLEAVLNKLGFSQKVFAYFLIFVSVHSQVFFAYFTRYRKAQEILYLAKFVSYFKYQIFLWILLKNLLKYCLLFLEVATASSSPPSQRGLSWQSNFMDLKEKLEQNVLGSILHHLIIWNCTVFQLKKLTWYCSPN